MRAKVWHLRTSSQLFSAQMYTNGLEKIYRAMWERYEHGQEADHLTHLAEPYS